MSVSYFSLAEQRALDSYTVPPLRDGFAARVVERALAERSATVTALPPLRPSQKRNPWSRAGRRVGAFVTLTILSGAAAAMGLFGNPERIPIIGEVIAQVFSDEPPARIVERVEPVLANVPVDTALEPVAREALPVLVTERPAAAPTTQTPVYIERPTPTVAAAPSRAARPSSAHMADIRRERPNLPARRLTTAAPDVEQIRERLTDAGIRDAAIVREKLAERIDQRIERKVDALDTSPQPELAADAAPVQPQVGSLPEPDRAQLRAQAAEQVRLRTREQRRQQLRERIQARPPQAKPPRSKPPRSKPRDIARQRRELRKRRR